MKRMVLAFAILAVIGTLSPAQAQDTKMARGTVSAIAADVVTVKTSSAEMKFTVDTKTVVEARGAGTASRAAQAAGQAGPKLTDVVKVGEGVEVSYHDMGGGKLHAAHIRAISASAAAEPVKAGEKISAGTVKTIAGNSLTITGSSGGGATFTQTFVIDATTKVIGRGIGTATAATGGRGAVTDLVKTGESVSVSYMERGSTLHASEIRVR
jgi:hypothetical protein